MKTKMVARGIAVMMALGAAPLAAQDDGALVTFQALKPEIAQAAAEAAMLYCRDGGYQVGVMVVDRSGQPQVFMRDRFAGMHVFETAHRKAWTAVSFKGSTLELAEATAPETISAAIRQLSMALPLGGGLVIEASGSIVAGIGVSGAPSPEIDDECAAAGIEAIMDEIAF